MPWNEPGNNGNKDPWGNRKKNDGPPDLDEVFKKVAGIFGGGNKGGGHAGHAGLYNETSRTQGVLQQSRRTLLLVAHLGPIPDLLRYA